MIRKVREVVAPLREGRLCLSSVGEVAKVLTVENSPRSCPGSSFSPGVRQPRLRPRSDRSCGRRSRDVVTVVAAHRRSTACRDTRGRSCDNPVVVPPAEPLLRSDSEPPDADHSAHRGPSPDAHHVVAALPRQARRRSRRPLPLASGRDERGHPRGRPRPPPRPAPRAARHRGEASADGPDRGAGAHPRRGEARGLGAGRGEVPVAARGRGHLRVDPAAGVRPRRAAGVAAAPRRSRT